VPAALGEDVVVVGAALLAAKHASANGAATTEVGA
jgi:hypothetical protein